MENCNVLCIEKIGSLHQQQMVSGRKYGLGIYESDPQATFAFEQEHMSIISNYYELRKTSSQIPPLGRHFVAKCERPLAVSNVSHAHTGPA